VRGFGERSGSIGEFEIKALQMLFAAAILGFLFGFVGSIPVAGPVAMLVVSRGLEDRTRSALYLASGAALAEGAYAYLAFWGFAQLLARWAWVEPASRLAAAVISTGLGVRFVSGAGTGATVHPPADPRIGCKRSFVLGVTLTALNPVLIAAWAAAVTALYSLDLVRLDRSAALPFSLGASAGVAAWFAVLLGFLQRLRQRVSRAALARVMRGMGVLLILLGLGFAARFAVRI
jgi:threonine/homoserine/homoserine lactone efflux protein